MDKLTQRQREILGLLSTGRSQKEVAVLLGLRHGTIRQQAMKIRERTGCSSLIEVVAKTKESPGT